MSIGVRLQNRAHDLGMKQNEIAKALGIPPTTLSGYFKDYREPDVDTLIRLAKALDTTVEYLIGERSTPMPVAIEQKKEPTPRDGMAQEILDMLEKVPDEKLPKFMTLLQTAIDATT